MLTLQAIFKGRVQGVGFRWTLVDYAKRHALKGRARNMSNGTVEVVAQGSKEDLEAFLNTVKGDPGLAQIDELVTNYKEAKEEFTDFRIAY